MGQTIDHFWINHDTFWSRAVSFQTSYIWTGSAIKDGKSYLLHNLYANPFAKVLGLVGCQVKSKILALELLKIIGCNTSISNVVGYHFFRVTHPRSSPYFMAQQICPKIHYGEKCVYNCTNMMVEIGLDIIVHHAGQNHHSRVFNAWIQDWESDILRT